MNLVDGLYTESHIIVAPVFDGRLEELKALAEPRFKVADLLMKKRSEDTPTKSMYDIFLTARGKSVQEVTNATLQMVKKLQAAGFTVYRYKVEDCVLDSKIKDTYNLLKTTVNV